MIGRIGIGCIAVLLVAGLAGCGSEQPGGEVVVYTAVDPEIAEPVFRAFTERTGIRVQALYPDQAPPGGWVRAILKDRESPQADVFWDDALLGTMLLARSQTEYFSPHKPTRWPDVRHPYKDPDGRWCGFALQPRVLMVNGQGVGLGQAPPSLGALADSSKWRDKQAVGLAGPASPTAVSHVACLLAGMGQTRARKLLRDLKEAGILRLVRDERELAQQVADGRLAMGLTDGTRFLRHGEAGDNVRVAYPDATDSKDGTLFLPYTAAIIRGSQHPDSARRLVDFLVSPDAAALLAEGPGGLIPLFDGVPFVPRLRGPGDVGTLNVDFYQAADLWDDADQFMRQYLRP